jgi:hypothetical protein
MSIQLEPTENVRPSTYNPRITDPERLELVKLSLRKLGFLLPLYTDAEGEILSGHQRHLAAEEMGIPYVPVERLGRKLDLAQRKIINVAFNRGTNDMLAADTPENITAELMTKNIFALAESLPDIDVNSADTSCPTAGSGQALGTGFHPCMQTISASTTEVIRINAGNYNQYTANVARELLRRQIKMPVIVDEKWHVINGCGRLLTYAQAGEETVELVVLPRSKVHFARLMLNNLSMDFNIHERYADLLRYHSFRRGATGNVGSLSSGYSMFAFKSKEQEWKFDISRPHRRMAIERIFGHRILDFGSGRLNDVKILRENGFDVTAFEPYYCEPKTDKIDRGASAELTLIFLEAVRSGKHWDSIMANAVMNSVPFYQDRLHIVTILSALAHGNNARVFSCAISDKHDAWRSLAGKHGLYKQVERSTAFAVGYEPRVKLNIAALPKAQKYHSGKEFHDLFSTGFQDVRAGYWGSHVRCLCRNPYPIDAEKLRAALEFEFDLPYPDGQRMGLASEAVQAFSQRLGILL